MKSKYLLYLIAWALTIGYFTSCKKAEKGCTDPKASNYNALATEMDSTCIYSNAPIVDDTNKTAIKGCTNPLATNYNPDATEDDGSCIIPGCMQPLAENYNPDATEDDGSCIDKREKFAGDWSVDSDCGGGFVDLGDPQAVTYNQGIWSDTIFIDNVIAGVQVYALVNGLEVTIPKQTVAGQLPIEVDGTGTMNAAQNRIDATINYLIDNPFFPINGNCTAVYTK